MKKPPSRLPWLLVAVAVLGALRWWLPPPSAAAPGEASTVPAIVRSPSASASGDRGAPSPAGQGTLNSAPSEAPVDLEGNAFAVRVIYHQQNVIVAGDLMQRGQRRDIPIHAEHAVGHDQAAAILGGGFDLFAQVTGITVFVSDDLRAR